MTARSIKCQCTPSSTCGHCCSTAKPYHFTPSTTREALSRAANRSPSKAELLALALASLMRRIEVGEEFPDACWAVASRQCVPYEALSNAYDEACL